MFFVLNKLEFKSLGAKSSPHIDNPIQQPTTPTRQTPLSNGSVGMDFGSELANRLKSRNKPVTEKNLQVNRGPPPQPPISRVRNISF